MYDNEPIGIDVGEDEVITLVDEDGNEKDFVVVNVLEVEGSRYAVLIPVTEDMEEEEEPEAIILKFATDENGQEILMEIEDDEEWEKVADAWEEMIMEEEEE